MSFIDQFEKWHPDVFKNGHELIADYAAHRSLKLVAQKYHIAPKKLKLFLEKNNVDVISYAFDQKCEFDRGFFKKIDTHEKAYWLGFIYADGNVHKNTFQITIKDSGHLEGLKSAMETDRKIGAYDGGIFRFSLGDPELVQDLKNLGIEPQKSLTMTFPTREMVSEEFLASFMLGYFDGDGCIATNKPKTGNRKWNLSIISTWHFCNEFKKILVEKCDLFDCKLVKYARLPDKDIWDVKICGVYSNRLKRIYDFLYKDINFDLKRKRNRIMEIIENNPKETYTSQYYGVSLSYKKWQVQIKVDGKMRRFGRFVLEEDAARCYDKILIENGLDLRYLNFPKKHDTK